MSSQFPYPTLIDGKREDGSLRRWPRLCQECKERACERGRIGTVNTCSYGMDTLRVDARRMIGGVVLRKTDFMSPARKDRQREFAREIVDNADFQVAANRLGGDKQLKEAKLVSDEVFKVTFLETMKPEILKGLSFVHDYKQINAQIVQNVNVFVEQSFQGATFDDKLAKASREIKAVYYAARLLGEKLDVAKFLLNPEWLTDKPECTSFRVHGLVTKYLRLYQADIETKGLAISQTGASHNDLRANALAAGVIPHTLIDNAVKYAPKGSKIEILVEDVSTGVLLRVSSFGPLISRQERETIFHPFVRGAGARKAVKEGAGYGLYVAQLVAKDHIGTRIQVDQSDYQEGPEPGYYWTQFAVQLPFSAKACR